MSADYDSDLTTNDIGAALLGWIAATHAMRHASPRGGLDYLAVEEGSAEALIRDFVACTTGHPGLVPGAKERIARLGRNLAVQVNARSTP